MCYGGYNQEDSLFFNKGSAQRGFTKGSHFGFIQAELDKEEVFGTPNIDITMGTKESYANYGKLIKGFPEKGTTITDKDIIIGKYVKLSDNNGRYTYKDTSIVYPNKEPSVIEKVFQARDQEGVSHVRVKHSSVRELGIGDKFCLLPTCEVLTSFGWKQMKDIDVNDMVCTLNPINSVIAYQRVSEKYKFQHNGELYKLDQINDNLNSRRLSVTSTFNHCMYVNVHGDENPSKKFKLIEIGKLDNKTVEFKNTGINNNDDTKLMDLYYNVNKMSKYITFSKWLKILGSFVVSGEIIYKDDICYMTCNNNDKNTMNVMKYYNKYVNNETELITSDSNVISDLAALNVDMYNRYLPNYVYDLGYSNSKILLNAIIDCTWILSDMSYKTIELCSKKLVDDVIVLALNAGMSASYTQICRGNYHVYIYDMDNIKVNVNLKHSIRYDGEVQCIQVPNHIFYIRQDKYSIPMWTGNSSRHGQKGVTGIGYNHSDMPFTAEGIVPDLVLNPHAIPSRMTIGQLLEGYAGKLAIIKGMLSDATIFKDTDLEAIGDELESLGWNRYSNKRMWCGITGDWIDTMIFITPTYYQRLLKFVVEEVYSISTGPTCVLTRQPLDGKANKGGLRIGEMEKDVIISHGSGHFIMEKYRDDSDGFDIYVCRTCGNRPVVNEAKNIIMCNTCQALGLDPQVYKVKSTWASKLFFDEIESMGVGVKLGLKPFAYEEY